MITKGTRLLAVMGTLLLALFVMVGAANAERLPPPDRPSGPVHPRAIGTLSTAVTIAESGVSTAADEAVIQLEGPVAVQSGEEFTVGVRVTRAVDLYGLQVALSVDLSKFTILAVTPGALFGDQATYQVGPTLAANGGSLSYAVTLTGKTAIPFGGDGLLATIRLKALGVNGQVAQVWSSASVKMGNPEAVLLPASVKSAPLLIGSPIEGLALSLGQPLAGLRVALVEPSTGYEIDAASTDQNGAFALATPQDGNYLVRANDVPFLPTALELDVFGGVPSVQQLQMDLTYGDWDGDGVVTSVDLDRFAALYYGEQLFESEVWMDIARQGSSLNRYDLRDLYHVAYNNGMATPPAVRFGWVYGTITNTGSAPIAGAAIDVRTLDGVFVKTLIADDVGFYTFPLPAGGYQLTYDAAGHEPLTKTITVNPLGYRQVFAALPSAAVALATPIQVDLNWNAVGDMDSWLLVPGVVAYAPGQVSTVVSGVGHQGLSAAHPWAVHSGDAVQSSGTESIVIHRLVPGLYEFWAHTVEGDLTVAMDADVIISGGTHPGQTISLTDSTGSGYQWRVFTLTVAMDGTYVINTVNTLHYPANLASGGSGVTTSGFKR